MPFIHIRYALAMRILLIIIRVISGHNWFNYIVRPSYVFCVIAYHITFKLTRDIEIIQYDDVQTHIPTDFCFV